MNLLAAIQAGGRSARMGEDKAWLRLAGTPLIEHVLRAAQPVASEIAIVIRQATAERARYEALAQRWNARLLEDPHDALGPLAGIHTTLAACQPTQRALVLACDLPFLSAAFLQLLNVIHEQGAHALTVPLDQTARPHWLCGIYERTCLLHCADLLAARRLRVDGLRACVSTHLIPWHDYATLPNAARLLSNVNTPADWQAACDALTENSQA